MKLRVRPSRMLFPWTCVVITFLYAPIALLVIFSFNASRLNLQWQGFTLAWYAAMWHDHALMQALANTLLIACITTAIALPLGTSAAWALHRYRPRFFRTIDSLAMLPIIMPDVVIGISLLTLFAITFRLLERLHVSPDWFGLGFTTVILSHVTFCFPFVMVTVRARLARLDPALEEAAMDLGATPVKAFRHVILPFLMPALISASLLTFTLSMDELIVTLFTYGSGAITLPVKVFGMVRAGMNPSINAISSLLIIITALLMSVADRFRRQADIR